MGVGVPIGLVIVAVITGVLYLDQAAKKGRESRSRRQAADEVRRQLRDEGRS